MPLSQARLRFMLSVTPTPILKPPFPWFGGKSRVAPLVWQYFGDPKNYVEPFAGSIATVLLRPDYDPFRHTETVNDLDCYLANFWRAVQSDPEAVAYWCDSPVNEADLSARHQWLVNQSEFRELMKTDPDYFDPKIAGWWVWGLCAWIGSGWCKLPRVVTDDALGDNGRGVHRQLPHLGDNGRGVHRQLPHLGNNGWGASQASDLYEYFEALADRLRRVRVCCGDWGRVLGASPTEKIGVTGIFLDPPYADTAKRCKDLYAQDSLSVAHEVREWAIANGQNPKLRIALCGYEGEHLMPSDWECIPWKAAGGYGSQRHGNPIANGKKERIWFSPHCLKQHATESLQLDFKAQKVAA